MILYRINLHDSGAQIKLLCKKRNLTPVQLQELLFLNSPQAIYHWFSGRALPCIDNLYNLSILLDTTINDLLVAEPVEILTEEDCL